EAILNAAQLTPDTLSVPANPVEMQTSGIEVASPARTPVPDLPAPMPALRARSEDVELTFEVDGEARPPTTQ
ncbi:MAG: hypothetical protein WBW40_00760, partial [Thermoplasmata archaeon]